MSLRYYMSLAALTSSVQLPTPFFAWDGSRSDLVTEAGGAVTKVSSLYGSPVYFTPSYAGAVTLLPADPARKNTRALQVTNGWLTSSAVFQASGSNPRAIYMALQVPDALTNILGHGVPNIGRLFDVLVQPGQPMEIGVHLFGTDAQASGQTVFAPAGDVVVLGLSVVGDNKLQLRLNNFTRVVFPEPATINTTVSAMRWGAGVYEDLNGGMTKKLLALYAYDESNAPTQEQDAAIVAQLLKRLAI